jgi:hypothetical protein
MNLRKTLPCAAVLLAASAAGTAYAQSSSPRQIFLAGTTLMRPASAASGGLLGPEIDPGLADDGSGKKINRGNVTGSGTPIPAVSARLAASNPELALSFDGLTHRDHRLANGGNQFSVEPPDQGLCAGNGFVLETVNMVLRVYDTNGNPAGPVTDLNTFYGYPAAIDRSTGAFGPQIFDPSCYFDSDTQRWFHLAGTADRVGTTSVLSGRNHLDLAVSQTPSPLGAWNIYRIPTQNDGTDGTPNHHCDNGPCAADYPHLGADANGIYISTNEYPFFPVRPGFRGAQIYALSKQALASGLPSVTVIQFDTVDPSLLLDGHPGFTVWPATTPASTYATDLGGTQYFLSSVAVFNTTTQQPFTVQSDNRLRIWALSNTQSLNTSSPALALQHGVVEVETYAVPSSIFLPVQKAGDFPLGQCLNDATLATPFGIGCWRWIVLTKPPGNEVEPLVYTSFSIMQGVVFADGKLWGTLNTGLGFGHSAQVGIAYFVIRPQISVGAVGGQVVTQGYLGLENNNLTYPAVGVTADGKGVISFTLVGEDHFPSAAYTTLDAIAGAGDIHVVAEGLGPEDGLFGYKAIVGVGPRPAARWGDYGATAVDGNSIWIASEYIGQTCTLSEFASSLTINQQGVCGGTRTGGANWYTRVSKISP